MPLRVMVDARPLSNPQPGGYRSALLSLLDGLRMHDGAPRLLLLVDRPLDAPDLRRLPPGAELVRIQRNRIVADLAGIPAAVRRLRPDLIHGTANYLPPVGSVPGVATLFDNVLLHRWPWSRSRTVRQRAMDAWWRVSMRRTARSAACILVPCEGVAADLRNDFPSADRRIRVVAPGLRDLPPPTAIRDARTVLIVDGGDPRKHVAETLPVLVDAATRGEFQLRVVRTRGGRSAARSPEGVVVRSAPDDEGWSNELARATTLVHPTLREGFGLPPLEAMRAGAAVVAGRVPHLGETLGDVPFECDPLDPSSVLAAVRRSLHDATARGERLARGAAWAGRHTPYRQASQTLDAWSRVA
ncbi:MAG: glycosyltransferase [Armatimonadota bacterium]